MMIRLVCSWRGLLVGMGGLILVLAACGDSESSRGEGDRPHFVTTIPPFAMILRPVVDGRGTVERLLEPGASPHTYDPTPSDLRAVTNATALVYGAHHLDGWAADLSASRRLELVDLLPPDVRLSFADGGPESRGGSTVDPHFWTDPLAVARLLPALTDTLCALDAQGCPIYRANADSFAARLTTLDAQLDSLTASLRETPVLLAQPFFRYFLRRYGPRLVDVVTPRPGTAPTARDLQHLIERADASGVRGILTQRQLSARGSEAVAEPSVLPLIQLDPLGGTAGRKTYSALMIANARLLRDSLAQVPQ